jgi:hypothetical protein
MALIFKTHTEAVVPGPVKQGFNWDAWYAKNKQRLSEKRAKRYREDAAYRAAALERSRHQRETKKPEPVVTLGYTVSFTNAAEDVGVTVWVLREWRRKNYFPEPHHREGRLWFSPHQVQLLRRIKHVFDQHGPRVAEAFRPEVESIVNLVYANWV